MYAAAGSARRRIDAGELRPMSAEFGFIEDEPTESRLDLSGPVSIVPIHGIIGRGFSAFERRFLGLASIEEIEADFRAAFESPDVRAIVAHFRTPGGSTDGLADVADLIRSIDRSKPVIGIGVDVVASAGYWLISQCRMILADQTCQVGNVGTVGVIEDASERDKMEGITMHVVRSGPFKKEGVDAVTSEQLAHSQTIVDALQAVFTRHVRRARVFSPEQWKAVAKATVWVGRDGIAAGMIDRVGTLGDAVKVATRASRATNTRAVFTGGTLPRRSNAVTKTGVHTMTAEQRKAAAKASAEKAGAAKAAAAAAAVVATAGVASEGAGDARLPPITADYSPVEMDAFNAGQESVLRASLAPLETDDAGNPAAPDDSSAGSLDTIAATDKPIGSTDKPLITTADVRLAIAAALSAERRSDKTRQQAIAKLGAEYSIQPTTILAAMQGSTTETEFMQVALHEMGERNSPLQNISVGTDLNRDSIAPGMIDAILTQRGMRPAYGTEAGKPHGRCAEFQGHRLSDMARRHMEAWGQSVATLPPQKVCQLVFQPTTYMPYQALQTQAAFGGGAGGHATSDFVAILRDAVNKSALAGFDESPRTWQAWMQKRTANDFKTLHAIRLGEFPALAKVEEGAEYTYATIGEAEETYALLTYGRLIAITFQTLINDDLHMLTQIPSRMGFAAARLENALAYDTMILAANGETMGDTKALFHADHGNLLSAAALSVVSLGAARAGMRLQTGIDASIRINVPMRWLIVPAALETLAQQLVASINDPAKSTPVPNPFAVGGQNPLSVIADSVLDLDAAKAGSSNTAWYGATDSMGVGTIECATLTGMEQPQITQIAGGSVDGTTFKVSHRFAAKAIDWRGMQKNPGV
jgi:ClpP class serine protease